MERTPPIYPPPPRPRIPLHHVLIWLVGGACLWTAGALTVIAAVR